MVQKVPNLSIFTLGYESKLVADRSLIEYLKHKTSLGMKCGQPLGSPEHSLEEARGGRLAVDHSLDRGHVVTELVEVGLVQNTHYFLLKFLDIHLHNLVNSLVSFKFSIICDLV